MEYIKKTPVFKNASGSHYLKALFYEEAIEEDRRYVLYSLKNYDNNGYPSIHQLFLKEDDPTEYRFAIKYFDSWHHWKMVRECAWFKPVYEAMKEELEIRLKSKAVADLRNIARDPKAAVQVNRYLIEKGYVDKEDTRGRPSKQKIKEEADKIFKDMEVIGSDYDRIVLNGW